MKPGDLITLVGERDGADLVEVGTDDMTSSGFFPAGTLALYIGDPLPDVGSRSRWTRLEILTGETRGWVYLYEVKVIDD
jgi:hypothetical protein